MQSRVRLFSPDNFLYSVASHCGPTRLAIWSRSKVTPLATWSGLAASTIWPIICGDLIFDGFKPLPSALHSLDEHDLALPSNSAQDIAPATAPTLNSELITPSMDGWIDPAMEAALSVAIEPNTDFTSYETRVAEPLDSSPAMGSEPPVPAPIKSD